MPGPYDTEAQAAADIRDVYDPPRTTGNWRAGLDWRLRDTCAAANVDLGTYDRRVVRWLADWEPATVQVICGLITRAYQAGHQDATAAAVVDRG